MTFKQLLIGAYLLMIVSNAAWFAAGLLYGHWKGRVEATKEAVVYMLDRGGEIND